MTASVSPEVIGLNLSQKKNCNGCRALTVNRFSAECSLGCSPRAGKSIQGLTLEFVPDRPCHKPKTNMQLIELSQARIRYFNQPTQG
jgi:hypothetical protein